MEKILFEIEGPALIKPMHLNDSRGYFSELFNLKWFKENVANVDFVQDNQSLSLKKGTIRGLHFQKKPFEQGKLVRCINGELFDVAVDIRKNSKTFGKWVGVNLSPENNYQLWVPPGFAHGFCTLKPNTIITYKVTDYYSRECDSGIAFNDSDIGIEWPIFENDAILSEKDSNQPALSSLR